MPTQHFKRVEDVNRFPLHLKKGEVYHLTFQEPGDVRNVIAKIEHIKRDPEVQIKLAVLGNNYVHDIPFTLRENPYIGGIEPQDNLADVDQQYSFNEMRFHLLNWDEIIVALTLSKDGAEFL